MVKKGTAPANLRGLLQDCKANPEDDTLRLILADWLDDHDQPERAEFVRLQVESEARTRDRRGSVWGQHLRVVEREERHGQEWFPWPEGDCSRYFDRGLISLQMGHEGAVIPDLENLPQSDLIDWVEHGWINVEK